MALASGSVDQRLLPSGFPQLPKVWKLRNPGAEGNPRLLCAKSAIPLLLVLTSLLISSMLTIKCVLAIEFDFTELSAPSP